MSQTIEFANRGVGRRIYTRTASGRTYEWTERHAGGKAGLGVRRSMTQAAWASLLEQVDPAAGDRVVTR